MAPAVMGVVTQVGQTTVSPVQTVPAMKVVARAVAVAAEMSARIATPVAIGPQARASAWTLMEKLWPWTRAIQHRHRST